MHFPAGSAETFRTPPATIVGLAKFPRVITLIFFAVKKSKMEGCAQTGL